MPAVKAHFRVLPYGEVSGALERVEASGASAAAKLCLRFLILTASRSGAARGATWAQMDAEAREWCVPGERMKGGAPHRVPLSDVGLAVLEAGARDGRWERLDLSFSAASGPSAVRDMSLTKLLRDRGLADRATVHGFRSAFRDWCAETGQPREIA